MKQIVIYKSRTGFTKKYAKWLAQSLNCECIPQEDVGGERLSDYDVIIFGSSFRAGNVEELKWYKETILPFEKTNVLFVIWMVPVVQFLSGMILPAIDLSVQNMYLYQ